MELKTLFISYDINTPKPDYWAAVTHENNVNTRYIELELTSDAQDLCLGSGCSVTAAFVNCSSSKRIIIDNAVACEINPQGNILIPLNREKLCGCNYVEIQVTVEDETAQQRLVLPYPLHICVTPDILRNASTDGSPGVNVSDLLQTLIDKIAEIESETLPDIESVQEYARQAAQAVVEQMIANVRSKNLLDVSATEQDVSLNYTNGDTQQAANRNTTDYIAVTPGMYLVSSYYVRRVQQPYSMLAICFYDSDKTFLSGSQSRFAAAVPEGAAFARVTGNTYFINPDFDVQLEMRETPYPTFYEPHRADAQGLNDQVIKANRIVTRDNRNGNFYHALPSKVFIKSGESLTVYFKNVLSHPKYMLSFFTADRVNNTESVSVTVFNYDNCAVFTASGSGTVKIPFSIHDDNFDLVDYGTLEAKVVSNDAPSASVLLIGDSTVEQGNEVSKALKNLYSGASGTLTLLGTRGTSPYNHEGRSGWKAQEYASVASKSNVLNAFWDGEAFNFSYYMSQQGYSSADAVVLQLGINDLISKSVEKLNASEIIGYIDAMVQSVRAFSATARVIINLVTPPNSDGESFTEKYHGTQAEWLYRYNTVKFNHLLREFYRGDNSVTVLGINLPLETYTDNFDGVHPRKKKKKKIAKTVYDCLAAQL